MNVYTECIQSAGGSKPTAHQAGPATKPLPVTKKTSQAIQKSGGKDSRMLAAIVKNRGYSEPNLASSGAAGSEPSALGSAFDLGSGPTILLASLAATALLLLGGSGFRFWRQRQHP